MGASQLASYDMLPGAPVLLTLLAGAGWSVGNIANPPPSTASALGAALYCHDLSGSTTAQSCTTIPASASQALGTTISYRTPNTNTGDLTLNVNANGAYHVRKNGGTSVLAAGDIQAGAGVLLTYDGTYWEIPGPGTAGTGSGSVTSVGLVGTANQIAVAGSSPITGAGSFTLSLPATVAIATALTVSASPPTVGSATGGVWAGGEGTCPAGAAGVDIVCANSSVTRPMGSWNGGTYYPIPQVIASGTVSLGTTLVSANSCSSAISASAAGVAATDVITAASNADPSGITGYSPAGGAFYIWAYPTAGNVNFKLCNNTASPITPGSAVTLNYMVVR